VRLTEKFIADPSAPLDQDAVLGAALHVKQELRRAGLRLDLPAPAAAVFTGGTVTAMRLMQGARHGVGLDETPSVIATDSLALLVDELLPLTLEERRAIPGMPAARADVLPIALVTLLVVAESAGLPRFHHSLYNLRWGLAAEALDAQS
jgi:exopolyphosphatase / guanosine-5'-triphosphate,3'-diphosphate pyrophosphatase